MLKKYRIFETAEDVDEWVSSLYTQKQLDELNITNNIDSPLDFYKGNGYRFMNECVRKGCIDNYEDIEIKSLQDLLLSKRIEDDIETYRYVDVKEAFILWKHTLWKQIFEYPSFLSTTLLWKQYSMEDIKRSRLVIKIRIPKGTFGTYLPEVNPKAPEFEILLPHHLKLKRIKWNTFEVIV